MRGKLIPDTVEFVKQRITPAHAGKTFGGTTNLRLASDHPRACGENIDPINDNVRYLGSPPRMRGKLTIFTTLNISAGITPAHAGKTYTRSFVVNQTQDHPRACGENIDGINTATSAI